MTPAAQLVQGLIRKSGKTTMRIGLGSVGNVRPAVVRAALCELRDAGLIKVNFSQHVARIKVSTDGDWTVGG